MALVGRPNVGKSTILNQLLGQKLAATTHKPQTTRETLLGVLRKDDAEVLLLDTPGHHRAKGPLNRFMMRQAGDAVAEADVVGYVVQARSDGKITPGNTAIVNALVGANKPVVLVINKTDRVREKGLLLPLAEAYGAKLKEVLHAVVPISARRLEGMQELVDEFVNALPPGPPLFEEDTLTDRSERAVVTEFIREKAILETQAEVPYAVAVTLDGFTDERPRIVRIQATIHVERPSQKGIMIGRQGAKLKEIGIRARKDIEYFLGTKVFLALNVRVTEAWTQSDKGLHRVGYGTRSPPGLGDEGL